MMHWKRDGQEKELSIVQPDGTEVCFRTLPSVLLWQRNTVRVHADLVAEGKSALFTLVNIYVGLHCTVDGGSLRARRR